MENAKNKKFYTRRKARKLPNKGKDLDYKDFSLLSQFINDRKKVLPRRNTGLNASDQRKIAKAIKRARYMALLPYTVLH